MESLKGKWGKNKKAFEKKKKLENEKKKETPHFNKQVRVVASQLLSLDLSSILFLCIFFDVQKKCHFLFLETRDYLFPWFFFYEKLSTRKNDEFSFLLEKKNNKRTGQKNKPIFWKRRGKNFGPKKEIFFFKNSFFFLFWASKTLLSFLFFFSLSFFLLSFFLFLSLSSYLTISLFLLFFFFFFFFFFQKILIMSEGPIERYSPPPGLLSLFLFSLFAFILSFRVYPLTSFYFFSKNYFSYLILSFIFLLSFSPSLLSFSLSLFLFLSFSLFPLIIRSGGFYLLYRRKRFFRRTIMLLNLFLILISSLSSLFSLFSLTSNYFVFFLSFSLHFVWYKIKKKKAVHNCDSPIDDPKRRTFSKVFTRKKSKMDPSRFTRSSSRQTILVQDDPPESLLLLLFFFLFLVIFINYYFFVYFFPLLDFRIQIIKFK